MTGLAERTKRPAFQFYPSDWRKDVELRSCSIAARGLWIEMMCLAHECEPYGHLTVNGRAMTAANIAGQVGLPPGQCSKLIAELIDNGVARRTEEGVIYSKRMVDDERVRNARAAGGKEGAEHGVKGAAHGSKGGRPKNIEGGSETPLSDDKKPPPSSSSSSSSSSSLEEPPSGVSGGTKRASKKCPGDFEVNAELQAWADEKVPGLDIRYETDKFRDWEFKAARSDWPATWRTWMRKAYESRVNGSAAPAGQQHWNVV